MAVLTQQQYQLGQGETPAAYSARIASLQGSAPGSSTKSLGTSLNDAFSAFQTDSASANQTILDTYKQRAAAAQQAGSAERSTINTQYGEDISQAKQDGAKSLVGTSEAAFGLGSASQAAMLQIQEDKTNKRVTTLERSRDLMLANSNANEAARMDTLITNEQASITQARKDYLDNLFKFSAENRAQQSFETPDQKRSSDTIYGLAGKYPDAGLTAADLAGGDLAAITAKIKNSPSYKLDIAKGNADIAKVYSDVQVQQPGYQIPGTGNLPQQNNNPLNVTLGGATKHWVDEGLATVAETADGRKFLKFNDPNVGFQAAAELLQSPVYAGLTVDAAMKKWSGQGYGAEVLTQNGVTDIAPGALIKSLNNTQIQSIIQAQATREGFYNKIAGQGTGAGADVSQYLQTTISGAQYLDASQFTGKDKAAYTAAAVKAGIPVVSKEGGEALTEIDNARLNMDSIKNAIFPMLPTDATGRVAGGALGNKLSKYLQTEDQLGAFDSFRAAAIVSLKAMAGTKGLRINQAEIALAVENDIPKITDTVGVAQQKLNNVNMLLSNAESAIVVKDRSSLTGGAGNTNTDPFSSSRKLSAPSTNAGSTAAIPGGGIYFGSLFLQ